MAIIAMTGTQNRMTQFQKVKVEAILQVLRHIAHTYTLSTSDSYRYIIPNNSVLLHGDCIGADTQVHDICMDINLPVAIFPPKQSHKRAFSWRKTPKAKKRYLVSQAAEQDYLARNHNMVDLCSYLIVIPKTYEEELRSGTWATYRYCKKKGNRNIFIVYRSGDVEIEMYRSRDNVKTIVL